MDIKSFPTDSYHKYKYLIIFLDDFTSMAWIILLHTKSTALTATHQFLQMVKTQFQVSVQSWMSDFGGEYKSATYDDLLKGEGIRIHNSAPHIPQQNGCAERFMHTLMDKAEAETTQKVSSVNWYSRELRKGVCTESAGSRLQRWSHWLVWGKTKRTKLEFSGWDLCPYILLHVFVHICTGSTDDCSRIFWYLVA